MFLKFCFGDKTCSIAFMESVLPSHKYWGSALAVAIILKFWRLGQMCVKLSLSLQWMSLDAEQSGGRGAGSCRARRNTGLANSLFT